MDLLITSEITKKLNIYREKVGYALRRMNIAPIDIARNTRLFDESAVQYVELFLSRNQFMEEISIKRVERLEWSNV